MDDSIALAASERLIERLRESARYPHPAEEIGLVETHISWVLLAGEYAYKIKKPLRLGFLDYSSLEKRRVGCEDELRLNRRTAPALYLDVVAVTGGADDPRVGAPGEPVEYAVRMRRFDQARRADLAAASGALGEADIDALARAIASFHGSAEHASEAVAFGEPEHVHAPARQNFEQLAAIVTEREALDRLRGWTEAEYGRIAGLLAERKRGGFVRECHGDLHLANVVLGDDGPLLYDCIEFNAELRWIDVMSEIAFLVMDLIDHDLAALGWRLLNRYLEHTGDYQGVRVLRYYLVYRAMVRAKVTALRAHQPHLGEEAWRALEAQTHGYLALAERLARDSRPLLAILHGVSGSGKTTLSQALLERLGAIRVRSDVERKRLHGLAAAERSGSALGGGIYDSAATRATYERLAEATEAIVAGGYPAIVDATFLLRAERERFRALADTLAVPFAIVSCKAPIEVMRERVAGRGRAARDASEAGAAVLERQVATEEPLASAEREGTVAVDTRDIASALEQTLAGLARRTAAA